MNPFVFDVRCSVVIAEIDIELPPIKAGVEAINHDTTLDGMKRMFVDAVAGLPWVACEGDNLLASLASEVGAVEKPLGCFRGAAR